MFPGAARREPPPQVHLRRQRLEALGRRQECRARETARTGQHTILF